MKTPAHILIVEDQTNVWEDFEDFFQPEIENKTLTLDFAATAKEGLKKLDTDTDLVIIDVILPDLPNNDELYFINSLKNKIKIKRNQKNPKGILVSAHKSQAALRKIASQNDWIVNSFVKPLKRNSLREAIEKTLNSSLGATDFLNNGDINKLILDEFREEAEIIKMKMKRSVQDILDAGKRLIAVKQKLPHGYFRDWIETELGCHYTTGVNLMRVATVFGDDAEKITQMGVGPSILYFLATPSTPKQAREKVIQLIEEGEKVSFADTKKIVKDYRKHKDSGRKIGEAVSEPQGLINQNQKSVENKVNQVISPDPKQVSSSKQQIIKVIPQQLPKSSNPTIIKPQNKWYQLGNHWLFSGYPDNQDFRKYLPNTIALTLAFPTSQEWAKDRIIPSQSKSTSIFYTPIEDLDLFSLLTVVRNTIELYTIENEKVLFSFFPEPEVLSIADSLGCQCIIAEPDPQQWQRLLTFWQEKNTKSRKR